jgi:hypothetical protein
MRRKPAYAAFLAVLALAALPSVGAAETTNTRIVSGPSGTISVDSATLAFASPEDGGFECRLDAGNWDSCSSPITYASLSEGDHRFEVRALNRPGNADPTPAMATFQFKKDSEAPETTIVSGPSGTIGTDAAIFGFESGEEGSSFECRLDPGEDSAWETCASPQLYSALTDGSHSFEVRASDEAGNTDATPAEASFAIDTTAPETSIVSAPGGTIDSAAAGFEFAATEPGSFKCRLDSSDPGDWSPCSSPKSYSALADGPHSFEVRAADALGNTDATPAEASFAVYTGPPKPLAGETLNLETQKGNVQLQCPGEDSYSQLVGFKQVPVGCLINTRNGVVDITASKGVSGELQNADFWGGVFVATQPQGDDQEVKLKLAGKRMCEQRGSAEKPVARASRGGRSGRKLWGSGKGNYSTSGSYGSATVRGTTWLVVDRCDSSTLIKVAEGTVAVRDFVREKSLTLTTGEQYLAKALIPRLNPEALP